MQARAELEAERAELLKAQRRSEEALKMHAERDAEERRRAKKAEADELRVYEEVVRVQAEREAEAAKVVRC